MTDFKRIPPEQAHAMRNAGAVIVDIRDPHSFATGHISQSAAAYLVNQGFSEVYSLDGGFELWRHTYPSDVEHDEQQ